MILIWPRSSFEPIVAELEITATSIGFVLRYKHNFPSQL